jgi:hypothetical protein
MVSLPTDPTKLMESLKNMGYETRVVRVISYEHGYRNSTVNVELSAEHDGYYKPHFVMPDNNTNQLPSDVKKLIIHKRNVTVVLTNGDKATSKCSRKDTFDPYVGFCIAYYKCKHDGNHKFKKALDTCIASAKRKGYAQAIWNNRMA